MLAPAVAIATSESASPHNWAGAGDRRLSVGLIRCNPGRPFGSGSSPRTRVLAPRGWEENLARYRDITPAEMTPAQRRVHDLIVAGRRGRFGGPFQLLIRAPEICEHAAKLGEHLRWGTSLPDRLSELAIITTARFWRAQYEWYAHAPLAEKAGVPAAAVEAIRRGETPSFEQKDEALVYRICTELFRIAAPLGRELRGRNSDLGRNRPHRSHRDHRLLHPDREHPERFPGPCQKAPRRPFPNSSGGLRQSALEQGGEAAGEGGRVRQLLAFDDPRLIQKQPGKLRQLVGCAGSPTLAASRSISLWRGFSSSMRLETFRAGDAASAAARDACPCRPRRRSGIPRCRSAGPSCAHP